MRPMWQTLLSKRVDVVGWKGKQPCCIEVKPLANMAALGQALSYTWLWNREGRSKQKALAAVCCERMDEDVEPVFRAFDVRVWLVRGVESMVMPIRHHDELPAR